MDFDPYDILERLPENATPLSVGEVEPGQLVMPFYIMCDVSGSMSREMPALNRAMKELFTSIARDPIIDDTVMISILTFDHTARVAVPLSAPSEGGTPKLRAGGGTSFAAAWGCYADAVARDYAGLKAEGMQVFRPCVFFLTDGDDLGTNWEQVFQRRLAYNFDTGEGNAMYPFVVAFGFGGATKDSLRSIAYPPEHRNVSKPGRWYLSASTGPAEMLKAVIPMIAQSVVNSGRSVTLTDDTGAAVGPSIQLDESWLDGRDIQAGNAVVSNVDAVF